MNSPVSQLKTSRPRTQSLAIAAIVLPPVLLVALLALAVVILIDETSQQQPSNRNSGSFVDTPFARAKYYDETTTIDRSILAEETQLAIIGLEKRFSELTAPPYGIQPPSSVEPKQTIQNLYANESEPILDAIRETAASESPIWNPGASFYWVQENRIQPYLDVIRFEADAAIGKNDSQRVLAALKLIPALSKNLDYEQAFNRYFWFDVARDFHRDLVQSTLETGIWTDIQELDAIVSQLDEFDRMGRERAGLKSPWKDSGMYDLDTNEPLDSSKRTFGQKLVRAVFGYQVGAQEISRPEAIRKLNAGQHLIRTAVAIKKYQLLNSAFPEQLSDLLVIGQSEISDSDSEPFLYVVAGQMAQLSLPSDAIENRYGRPTITQRSVSIR